MSVIDDFTGEAQAAPDYFLPDELRQPYVRAITADGIPVRPPSEWFIDPRLKTPSPLNVSADGKVWGHIATWNTSHIGMAGSVKPPKSRSNYAFFATGSLETADSQMIDVGQITLVGGHAPLDADVPRAVAHYDETRSAVADVAIGEDRFGIWVAGALRPDVDDLKVRQLRASAVSGDWRPINGNLELVAVCSVNVPGFPIPRARVASGQVLALVAAGIEPLVEARLRQMSSAGVAEAIDALSDRLSLTENALIEVLTSAGEEQEDAGEVDIVAVNQLRHRVYEPLVAAAEATDKKIETTRLRNRVHRPFDPTH